MELTKEQRNCEYCHPYSGIPGDDAQEFDDLGDEDNYRSDWGIDLYITQGNQLMVTVSAGYFGDYYIEKHPFNKINFCPMCGRSLLNEIN